MLSGDRKAIRDSPCHEVYLFLFCYKCPSDSRALQNLGMTILESTFPFTVYRLYLWLIELFFNIWIRFYFHFAYKIMLCLYKIISFLYFVYVMYNMSVLHICWFQSSWFIQLWIENIWEKIGSALNMYRLLVIIS